jgi:hypothetical protein
MKEFKNMWEALDMPYPTDEEKAYFWQRKFKEQQNDMRLIVSASIAALVAYEGRVDRVNGRYGPIDNEMDALRKALEGR